MWIPGVRDLRGVHVKIRFPDGKGLVFWQRKC